MTLRFMFRSRLTGNKRPSERMPSLLPFSQIRRPASAVTGALFLLCGCSAVISVSEYPFKQIATFIETETGLEKPVLSPVEVENDLMRFADNFVAGATSAFDTLRSRGLDTNSAQILRFQIAFLQDIYGVATGPNPYGNLLDMVTLVSLSRLQLESNWMPGLWGDSARPLLKVMQQNEATIWKLAGDVLKPEMQKELRQAIDQWGRNNQQMQGLTDIRATGFANAIAKHDRAAGHGSGASVFDLLDIDPLSSLDPATQELARSRRFAERALFLAQRMPTVLRLQTQLLTLELARIPEMESMVQATGRLSVAAESLSQTAAQLPTDIRREREATLKALEAQAGPLAALAAQVQKTLEAGNRMFESSDQTFKTYSALHAQIVQEPKDPNAPPFNIKDYLDVARETATTATELNALVSQLTAVPSGSPDAAGGESNLAHLSKEMEARGERLANRLLLTGLILIAAASFGLFLALTGARWVAHRWLPDRGR